MNRFQKRQAKRQAQKIHAEKQAEAIVIAAANVASAWALVEAEWMKRKPILEETDANYRRRNSLPLYEAREGATVLY